MTKEDCSIEGSFLFAKSNKIKTIRNKRYTKNIQKQQNGNTHAISEKPQDMGLLPCYDTNTNSYKMNKNVEYSQNYTKSY